MRRRPKPSDHDPALSRRWIASAVNGKACCRCSTTRRLGVVIQGHHPVPQQALRREFSNGAIWHEGEEAWVPAGRDEVPEPGDDRVGRWAWKSLQAILWDTRNAAPLCVRCHERHTLGVERVKLALLPLEVTRFALDHRTRHHTDFMPILEREHPL